MEMTKGEVTKIAGEEDRYYVKSFGSSHNSDEEYIVDLSEADFGCSCPSYDFRVRPIIKQLQAIGKKPLPELGCKHIQQAAKYRRNWEQIDDRAAELVGQVVVFPFGDLLAAGKITKAEPIGTQGLEPCFALEVAGRTGKVMQLKTNEFSPCYYESFQQADLHIATK